MTREEAIEAIKCNWPDSRYTILREALDMAISALRQQDVTDKYVGKMTNAQKIRAMTDDELNELFHDIYNAGAEDAVAYEWGQRTNSFEWTMEWLQQPAEEDCHSICGATNLPCIRCNPGGCDNRKEGADNDT